MPVHIDKMDTEIELVASPGGSQREAPATVQSSGMQGTRTSLRETVRSVLEAELDEYMRMRG